MDTDDLLNRRLERILQAVSLDQPDRVPVVLEYAGFAARATGTPMAEFVSSPARATQTMIQAYRMVGGGDAINYGSFSPYGLSYAFGAKVRVPGIDLPDDDEWQVHETELMARDDYSRILNEGWKAFFRHFLAHRVFDDAPTELLPKNQLRVDVRSLWAEEGIPVLSGGDIPSPFELLCGARSLEAFFMDLVEIPETVLAVMDKMCPHFETDAMNKGAKEKYPIVWVGGWRTTPALISPVMWERFVWPYLRRIIYAVLDSGVIPLLHLDSNWDRELARFREFPKRRMIMALDGDTNILRAHEILGERICLMGDVPPALLAFGSPDAVFDYCHRLIRKIGPDGFILQSGCDIPPNAPLENVQAMVAAAMTG